MKRFKPKDPPDGGSAAGGPQCCVDFKGQKRSNATHRITTDPDAMLYRKGPGMGRRCTASAIADGELSIGVQN
jgi:hypothetical protein